MHKNLSSKGPKIEIFYMTTFGGIALKEWGGGDLNKHPTLAF